MNPLVEEMLSAKSRQDLENDCEPPNRIDHAGESRDCLDRAEELAQEGDFVLSDLNVKAAQVHATLELVERLRDLGKERTKK